MILIEKLIKKNNLTLKNFVFIGLLSLIFNSNSYSQSIQLSLDNFDSNYSTKTLVSNFNELDKNNSFNPFSPSEEIDNSNNLENNFDLVSFTFSDGFLGSMPKNNPHLPQSILTFSTLGISSVTITQNSNNGEFGGSGNGNNVDYDVEVTFNLNTGSSFTLDATFSWREPSSGNIAIIGLEFKNNVNQSFTYGSSTYTIDGGTQENSTSLGLKIPGSSISFSDGDNRSGANNPIGILDWLNAQTSNTGPVAVADTATVAEDASLTSIDVITNDTDVDGDALTLTAVTTAGSGTVAINGVSVDYTPAANFNGEEVITYTVSDGTLTDEGTLTITVTAVNDAPTITGTPSTSVDEDQAYSFTPTGADVDAGTTLTYSITGTPSWASFDTSTGALTGTPDNDDVGTDSDIVITVSDGDAGRHSISSFSITVANVNDAPDHYSEPPSTSEDEDQAYSPILPTGAA